MKRVLISLIPYFVTALIMGGVILLALGVYNAQTALATPEGWFGLWYSAAQVGKANAFLGLAVFGGILAGVTWAAVRVWRMLFVPREITKKEEQAVLRKVLRSPSLELPETSAKEALDEVSREPVLVH